ncbi:TetR/AcrR family transcriptional regulator [Hoyosella rhizosphaerae]|uniref:TetR family transcriptional regulator n=1 Tax=Hoyosella rhizosphaerae TaxID=1755582 RepID=A0A916XEZ7_9ACTN|nr:TetR/AcrR family transcriptional regulator [Hoyosella rhizosphaerae]MBN4925688.1 TetR/AcrR family transcriptional regulator [Hoyosella rhizosphaerae]GGC68694.1 TetR family transcriptional regulator [Hoyosella rhizosphaerae]
MAYRQTPAVKARLAQTREDIVAAATHLVHEYGYAGCAMSAVAERAGIATGTIYRFFPSKGELFAEVFRTACSREVAAVTNSATRESDPVNAVVAAMETFCYRALSDPKMAYALLAEPVDPLVDEQRLQFRAAFSALLATGIIEAIKAGKIPPQDPQLTSAAIVGAVGDALISPLGHRTPAPEVVPQLLTLIRRAIGS